MRGSLRLVLLCPMYPLRLNGPAAVAGGISMFSVPTVPHARGPACHGGVTPLARCLARAAMSRCMTASEVSVAPSKFQLRFSHRKIAS